MASLLDVMAQVQLLMRALPGMRYAPDLPPDSISQWPTCVCYPHTGTWDWAALGAGKKKSDHMLAIEIHVARKDELRDVSAAMQFAESVPNAIFKNPTLGGTVTKLNSLTYSFRRLDWDTPTVGFQFLLSVRMDGLIT